MRKPDKQMLVRCTVVARMECPWSCFTVACVPAINSNIITSDSNADPKLALPKTFVVVTPDRSKGFQR
jgi:hypothetical protein